MKIKLVSMILAGAVLGAWRTSAEAAQQFTVAQINPAPGSPVVMGSTQLITFRITNTNTGGNAGERIYYVRFQPVTTACAAPCRLTTFNAGATAAPANWSKQTSLSTSIIFEPNTYANAIPAGGSLDFTISVYMGSRTADFTETLRRARVRYTTSAGGTCCPATYSQTGSTITINNPASLALKSLSINAFQTTDCAGTPIMALTAGNNFCVVMTVQNFSSTAQNGIVTSPASPLPAGNILSPGVTEGYISTTNNPNPLNLTAGAGPGYVGASGTITFRYSTQPGDKGTIQFINLNAQRIATVTSPQASSNVLSVSNLTVSLAVRGPVGASPTCVFSGDTATFTMTVTNSTGAVVTNVTPSALTRFYPIGAPTIGAFTGPAPVSIANIANGASGTFTWTATVTGTVGSPKPSFYVTGNVTYNGGATSLTATSNTEDVDGYVVSLAPLSTNALSANEELQWSLTNYGCAKIQSISIAGSAPAGWTWTGGDSYSLVGSSNLETWTVGGANPPVVFSAPVPADQLAVLESGAFSLVFPTTPTPAGFPTSYTFNITITDANATPIVKTVPTTVTVNAYNTGGANAAGTQVWREDFR